MKTSPCATSLTGREFLTRLLTFSPTVNDAPGGTVPDRRPTGLLPALDLPMIMAWIGGRAFIRPTGPGALRTPPKATTGPFGTGVFVSHDSLT
ncbi:hypothetical protein GCM10022223_48690 [Kineosporia mesophila]|uniref:Uncharacterized protein n=1 Tax=Kineosporia mesophila TaxID=566012 RepID=A0ABP7A677_9ACTN